ncbi:HAD family phosphatase [Thermopolyspora sp. NPDC052614]|uniref:HAD family hydrolase n=1 Tax=Thermopolyspora sp. NPDC052614 TaxID=3155682 RepID=UPI0034195D79
MAWIIFDFAGVIGLHQPQADQDAMVKAAQGPTPEEFWEAYWNHREQYDGARVTAEEYWSTVAPAANVRRLVKLDVESWLHPDEGTVRLLDDLSERGHNLALLSNAPLELADAVERLPWLGRMDRLFFSSRLGMVKPDREIYLTVAAELGVEPAECVFVDDRPANVAGAEEAGMTGVLFEDAASLRRRLLPAAG